MRDLMLGLGRLARQAAGLATRDDRGAIGVLIGILLTFGVVTGMGALVVDVGRLYQNRAELQNGADAGALAVAKSCALSTCEPSLAPSYADGNSSSGLEGVSSVCGSGSLGTCPASTGAITDCPAAPLADTNYVDVHTQTETASGSDLLPPSFAGALYGNSGYQGSTVKACAQAEWGAPDGTDTIAFTVSACTWYVYTSNGTSFAQPPPYPPSTVPSASADHIIYEHGKGGPAATGCPPYQPSGQDAPGNFGWTSDAGDCQVAISAGTYTGNTGASASSDCKTAIENAQTNKTVVYLPVYSSVTGSGSSVTYSLLGFAAFVITGYHITGSFSASDWLNSANNCSGSSFCIDGYFTQALIPSTGELSGPNLGATIIKLSG